VKLNKLEKTDRHRSGSLSSPRTQPRLVNNLFGRYGHDLVIVWDADDVASDLYVQVACSVARALAIRQNQEKSETTESVQEIERATRAIEKQLQHLDEFKKWGETVKCSGEKIADRAERMKKSCS